MWDVVMKDLAVLKMWKMCMTYLMEKRRLCPMMLVW